MDLILLVWFLHQWCLLWEVQCTTRLNHRETSWWKSVNAFGWVWLKLLIHTFNNVCKKLLNNIFVSISLPSGIVSGTGAANTQRGSTGWTGQRRDMRLLHYLMFLTKCFFRVITDLLSPSVLQKLLIAQIKMVLRVLFLYMPLPVFWTLFDQKVIQGNSSKETCCELF